MVDLPGTNACWIVFGVVVGVGVLYGVRLVRCVDYDVRFRGVR